MKRRVDSYAQRGQAEEMKISVVIPALNEAPAIGDVVRAVPGQWAEEIIVVDNGSTDGTAEQAAAAGARVIREPFRGYGAACLAGARAAKEADIIVFLDGDRSDDPGQLAELAAPILADTADLVIGSRFTGKLETGAMPWHSRLGNRVIAFLLRRLYGIPLADLGSFRAVRTKTLFDLRMEEMTCGWPVEMVVKAARKRWRIATRPVRYRRRLGVSKVSGTFRGSLLAAYFMFCVPLRYFIRKQV